MEDKEKRRAEVRAKLEAESAGKKKKGGFMTPARKQKLRLRELAGKVNDRPGKFSKPNLKKVSKTAQQMEKILMFTAKISQSNYRQGLKVHSVKEKDEEKKEEEKEEVEA